MAYLGPIYTSNINLHLNRLKPRIVLTITRRIPSSPDSRILPQRYTRTTRSISAQLRTLLAFCESSNLCALSNRSLVSDTSRIQAPEESERGQPQTPPAFTSQAYSNSLEQWTSLSGRETAASE